MGVNYQKLFYYNFPHFFLTCAAYIRQINDVSAYRGFDLLLDAIGHS